MSISNNGIIYIDRFVNNNFNISIIMYKIIFVLIFSIFLDKVIVVYIINEIVVVGRYVSIGFYVWLVLINVKNILSKVMIIIVGNV